MAQFAIQLHYEPKACYKFNNIPHQGVISKVLRKCSYYWLNNHTMSYNIIHFQFHWGKKGSFTPPPLVLLYLSPDPPWCHLLPGVDIRG